MADKNFVPIKRNFSFNELKQSASFFILFVVVAAVAVLVVVLVVVALVVVLGQHGIFSVLVLSVAILVQPASPTAW